MSAETKHPLLRAIRCKLVEPSGWGVSGSCSLWISGWKIGEEEGTLVRGAPKDGEAGLQSWGRFVRLGFGHSRRNHQIPPGRGEGQISSFLTEGKAQNNP